jgi:hypothetical protein
MTSTIKVNNIQNQCGANIANKCGTTITLGASGDTVTLACGASQTGFGRTGTVDWDTTAKTASFTAVSGNGYFVNTTSGAITVTLPAGSAGDIISLADYTNTFQTNNLTISPNGSQKIGGVNDDAVLSTEGQSVTFVYVDDTEGWKNVQDSTSNVIGNEFIIATGGTETTCGNCKIHTFTGPGTFCVSAVHPCAANNLVSYMVVAGGGGGGGLYIGGGGGAGGFREYKSPVTPYTASPLDGNPGGTSVTVTATAFPITVGGGGAGNTSGGATDSTSGVNSTFSTITSAGGGFGKQDQTNPAIASGSPGGSGGGGNGGPDGQRPGGTGNTPPVSPPQGTNGGIGSPGNPGAAGGGGGATVAGSAAPNNTDGGAGGTGTSTSISGSSLSYAGGGGGSGRSGTPGAASPCGTGGQGGNPSVTAVAGTTNRGGGGGGSDIDVPGNGGSGIVVIRYKFQ